MHLCYTLDLMASACMHESLLVILGSNDTSINFILRFRMDP